jgi:hypothetical protein
MSFLTRPQKLTAGGKHKSNYATDHSHMKRAT